MGDQEQGRMGEWVLERFLCKGAVGARVLGRMVAWEILRRFSLNNPRGRLDDHVH